MAVNTTHPLYDKYKGKWQRCRDASDGQDAVHEGGTTYLPALKDQDTCEYEAYKQRTPFYNATWRTIAGLRGLIMRKPPRVVVPPVVEPLIATVTKDGIDLTFFASEVIEECLTVGRVGVLVEVPVVTNENLTLADAKTLNIRPTLEIYETEVILNWRTEVIANRRVLTFVVLEEEVEIVSADGFDVACKKQWRVLDLMDGAYRVRIYQKNEVDEFIQVEGDLFPKMNNQPMPFIPFFILTPEGMEFDPDEPPLIDLVDLNLSHYRTAADYEHGCHFTGLPTGWIAGHTLQEGETIYLGSQSMLVFPNAETNCGFLEFSGAGLGALKENLERKELQMAVLGARMLEAQKRAAEAAETAAIHRAGENSLLADVANSISIGLQMVLTAFSKWAGGDVSTAPVEYALNRDFFPTPMDAGSLSALVSSWQQGAISKETLFDNLKQGGVISDTKDFETEQVQIQNQLAGE